MKLFLISQKVNNDYGTYDSAVVCAPDEETARRMDPGGGTPKEGDWDHYCWAPYEAVSAEYLGEARDGMPVGLVVASFNAG